MKYLKQFIYLVCSEVIGLSAWGASLPSWESALDLEYFWKGAAIAASVLLAWLGYSPIQTRKQQ